jgi:hypothetical protein
MNASGVGDTFGDSKTRRKERDRRGKLGACYRVPCALVFSFASIPAGWCPQTDRATGSSKRDRRQHNSEQHRPTGPMHAILVGHRLKIRGDRVPKFVRMSQHVLFVREDTLEKRRFSTFFATASRNFSGRRRRERMSFICPLQPSVKLLRGQCQRRSTRVVTDTLIQLLIKAVGRTYILLHPSLVNAFTGRASLDVMIGLAISGRAGRLRAWDSCCWLSKLKRSQLRILSRVTMSNLRGHRASERASERGG